MIDPPERLPERDADVFDRVMRVDMQIALGRDLEIEHAVARDLVEHVVEERHAGGQRRFSAAVKIEGNADLRFVGIARDLRLSGHGSDIAVTICFLLV